MTESSNTTRHGLIAVSGRKGSTKVRSGCITCKTRKVKCDEGKPVCIRCLKSGHRCQGYLDPSIMRSRRKATKRSAKIATERPQPSLSLLTAWALPEERRSLHFFQHVTAPQLADDADGLFWSVLVLQICQTEPSVRHAVLAVSSLHETTNREGDCIVAQQQPASQKYHPATTESDNSFALQQYNKAIKCLIGQMEDTISKPLAPLLTCVLFACLEFMHGKDRESLIHFEQGRTILSKLDRMADSRDPEMDLIKRHLVPLYSRMGVTSFLLGGCPVPIPASLKSLQERSLEFKSVHEIRFVLNDLMDEALRLNKRAKVARYGSDVQGSEFSYLSEKRQDILLRLRHISIAFSKFKNRDPLRADEVVADVIEMYMHATNIWVSTALGSTETRFDDHIASFSAIIPLATAILDRSESPLPTSSSTTTDDRMHDGLGLMPRKMQRTVFTFDTCVIPILYHVATKCRHPLVRHAALDLLKQNPYRRENLWQAKKMAAIAEYIVQVEEECGERQVNHENDYLSLSDVYSGFAEHQDHMPPNEAAGFTASSQESSPLTDPYAPHEDLVASLAVLSDAGSGFDMARVEAVSPANQSYAGDRLRPPPQQRQQRQHYSRYYAFDSPSSSYELCDSPPATYAGRALACDRDHYHPQPAPGFFGSLEAPFQIPEHSRVHDVIINPETSKGTWLMVFRKLEGMGADWNIQTTLITA